MSRIGKDYASKEDSESAKTRGRAQEDGSQAAIARMMGPQARNANSKAPPRAGAAMHAEAEGAAAATGSPPKSPREAPGPAAASQEKVWCLP
jgi:hypothetical protein